MLAVGILIFFLITLLPGLVALRLLRSSNLHTINALLYAIGLGLIFNVIAGLVANFTFGFSLVPVVVAYVVLLIGLCGFSYKFGKKLPLNWRSDWKSAAFIMPIGVYLLAVVMQLQTTLISPNLVGSDIHLEYYCARMTLENGFWDPMLNLWTVNSCLGITMLTPVYSLLTGIELMDVFRIICPLVFAFLPLALYRIFKMQFGAVVAVLSVLFFVTMPMFTMDMVQLIRQQQSELFFVLVVLLLIDDNMSIARKIMLGVIFGVGAITTHYGLSVGYVGYLLIGSVVVIILAKAWGKRHGIVDAAKPILPRLAMMALAVISLGTYIGYYSWVNSGSLLVIGTMPVWMVETTVGQVVTGMAIEDVPSSSEAPPSNVTFLERFPFLNPFSKEPLVQTALGLDFSKASALGKVWRVLQYLVEICLAIGLFALILRPRREVRLEYMAFVIISFFVLVGVFVLPIHSYGLGITRVWQVTLLFMSPLFVLGASTIGGWIGRLKKNRKFSGGGLVIFSTMVLFIPYCLFNTGVVFELSKSQPVGYVDIPYSVVLSGHRVDIATVFDKEDVEAVDWLDEHKVETDSTIALYSDIYGSKLLGQTMGYPEVQWYPLNSMDEDSAGYIFLRKRNIDTGMVTYAGDYGSSKSYSLDDDKMAKEKLDKGTVIFDNGARIILIE